MRSPLDAHETGEWRPTAAEMAASVWTQYLHQYYWCMGLMTGFGDGTQPESVAQYAFTLFVINLGLFLFAYTVGVLGASKRRAEQSRGEMPSLPRPPSPSLALPLHTSRFSAHILPLPLMLPLLLPSSCSPRARSRLPARPGGQRLPGHRQRDPGAHLQLPAR